jgi:hypothetical protein
MKGLQAGAAGVRDRFVSIEGIRELTVGESGFPGEDWRELECTWMSREDVFGTERFNQPDQEIASGQTRWVCAYRPCLDPEQFDLAHTRRLVYKGRTYDILHAVPLGRERLISMLTLARTG